MELAWSQLGAGSKPSVNRVLDPQIPDPCKLGWVKEEGGLVPVLSEVQAAPEAVVELFRCNCGVSKCAGRCTCKSHNLACTELCKCEANEECCNTHTVLDEVNE